MKITNISGLGSFGHYIDDVDFNHITDEEWFEIGKLHLQGLVTILRNVNITKDQYYQRIQQFGPMKGTHNSRRHFQKKYGDSFDGRKPETFEKFGVTEKDARYLKRKQFLIEETEGGKSLTRICGTKDEHGNHLGVFAHGELFWHSNESAQLTFAPGVALLGSKNMIGSSTGFIQTADYYHSVSESFRSELDEMVIIHQYKPGGINSLELTDSEFGENIKAEFCPQDSTEVPMVITSPGGIKGLHYTSNTLAGIKGMTKTESDKVFSQIDKELFTDKYIYDHKYTHDNELCLFDNSITLHRRKDPGHPDRLAYRIQYDFSELLDSPWYPYHQQEFAEMYKQQTHELINILEITNFKLP